ncbi:nitrogen fixation protein NifQ [Xanthobacter pseudotagetidis]|uniref:nitrogen fixation protein NifQ n=1 Tax=Xanthobacter pseudotagetidis TaxID=3119911 RepID=UPI00372C3D25
MVAADVYRALMDTPTASACDPFDRHVVAAILSLALAEADAGGSALAGLGMERGALLALVGEMFPEKVGYIAERVREDAVDVDEEERNIRDILAMYASSAGSLERGLVCLIARRARAPHHLWQDLGLRNRGELSELMARHFAPLKRKNSNDMKWKKFLYRMVCGSAGFTLCTAPVCAECDDFHACFGAEDGESRLAIARNGAALGLAAPQVAYAAQVAHAPER